MGLRKRDTAVRDRAVGKEIQRARRRLNLFQRDVAALASVSEQTVSNIERGRAVTQELRRRVLETLGRVAERKGPATEAGLGQQAQT